MKRPSSPSRASERFLAIIAFICLVCVTGIFSQISLTQQFYENVMARDDSLMAPEPASSTAPKPQTTMVHYDPYIMGGFRNMHMRFVAFVASAVDRNISQILLPSLHWGDPENKGMSIRHELLFDVPYWNARAESAGLPRLVNYDADVLEGIIYSNRTKDRSAAVVPCFNETSGLYSGMDEALLRNPGLDLRKVNYWDMIGKGEAYSHCRRGRSPGENEENDPAKIEEAARQETNFTKVHRFTHLTPRGGLDGGAGPLWWEYSVLQKNRDRASVRRIVNGELVRMHPEHVPVESAIYELLRPSQHLQRSIEDAVHRATQNRTKQADQPRILAIHPRIEQVMLRHHCRRHMESNITKFLNHIQSYPPFLDGNSSYSNRFDLVFMAVNKKDVDRPASTDGTMGKVMDHNRGALKSILKDGLFHRMDSMNNSRSIPIFESGRESATNVRFPKINSHTESSHKGTRFVSASDLGVVELVSSVINFFTAVMADAFVGVRGSTWSTDVISVRYYQQKLSGGRENYIVGPNGIKRFYGPAAPHYC